MNKKLILWMWMWVLFSIHYITCRLVSWEYLRSIFVNTLHNLGRRKTNKYVRIAGPNRRKEVDNVIVYRKRVFLYCQAKKIIEVVVTLDK